MTNPKITGTRLVKEVVKWKQQQSNQIVLPNIYVYDWESDVFFLDSKDEVIEYEIKVSKSDFFADFNKVDKHAKLEKGKGEKPNQFYYVVPKGLIEVEDVPKYAGLIYWTGSTGYFKIVKQAPLLNLGSMPYELWRKIAMKLYYKTL